MSVFPMQLKAYFISEFHFALEEGYIPSDTYSTEVDMSDLKIKVETFQHEDNPRAWRFCLKVALDVIEPKYPYRFAVVLDGFFEVAESHPIDEVEALVKVNAPALLYSSSRELLVTMTARGIHPPMFLPTLNFFEFLKSITGEENQDSIVKEALPEKNIIDTEKPNKTKNKSSKTKATKTEK